MSIAPSSAQTPAEGRVAVVTGATGGVGQAIAHRLADEGFRLALVGRRVAVLDALADEVRQKQPGGEPGRVATVVADLGDEGAATRMIEHVHRRYGRVDVLVNSAGGWSRSGLAPFCSKTEQDLRDEIEDNLVGTVLACHAAARHMVRAAYGRIVNLSSVAGLIGLDGHGAYSAAKAGHAGLARQLAMELGSSGVTVNCVAPGPVSTPTVDKLVAEGHPALLAMLSHTPSGRLTSPEEVADAVAFLAAEGSRQINGQVLAIDGGMTSA